MTKQDKVAKVMHEWKAGTLTSNGKQVTDYDQAVAIALSEAGLSKYAEGGGIGNDKMKVNITKNEFQTRKDDSNRVFHWYEGNVGDYSFTAETDNNGINGINKGSIYNLYISKVGGSNIARYNNKWEYRSKNPKDGAVRSAVIKYIDSISDKKDGEPKYKKDGNMNKYAKGGAVDAPKIYVADLEAYNNGKLVGEWLDLSDFEDGKDVSKEISKLLKKWGAEEYAIHDVENVPSSIYSEYMGEEDFDKIIKIYKASEENDLPYEVISEIMLQYEPEDLEEWISEHYEGHFDNDTDLAYSVVESIGGVSDLGKKTTEMYFDYEGFGRDLEINDEWEGDFDSNEDRGYDYVENMGGVSELGDKTIDMYFDYEKFGRDLAINDYTEIEDGYYFRTPRYAKGGLTNERRYVNKSQDYEVRYAKNRLKRTGYKNERKFAVGGEIGNTVSFKGDYGTPRSGVVKEKRGSSYIVSTEDGDRLVDSYEVISFSETPIAKKKRFGFFAGGGSVEEYKQAERDYDKYGEYLEDAIEDENEADIKKYKKLMDEAETKMHRYERKYEGGGEIENKIEKLKKVVSSKMLPESVKAKAQAEIDKLEKQLHESKETKAEEKAEENKMTGESEGERKAGMDKEARLDEKEELNATIQKLYGIESKAEDLINYQSGGIQGQSVDKIKKYVEYVNKEVSKLDVPFGSEVFEVLEDENAHSLNLTLGLLGFYKNERDSGEWAKKYEQYAKVIEVVNEVKGGGKSEAKEPTTIKFGNITFTIDSAELENGGNVYGGHIDIYNRVIKGFPYNYKTAKEVEERMKSYIKEIKSVTYNGSKGRESQKLPYLVIFNDGQAEIKEKFETAKEALNFQKVLDSIVNSNNPSKPTTRKAPVKKAVVKKKVEGLKPKFKVGDVVLVNYGEEKGVVGAIETVAYYEKYPQSMKPTDIPYYEIKGAGKEISENNLELYKAPKADHKKLVAKLKAKKGGKEYDNRASLVPFTDKRRERSESSDKKRSALPPGKRVSENGVTYYESRLNRTDLSKKDKFEDGGEVKGSDWGLNLNW